MEGLCLYLQYSSYTSCWCTWSLGCLPDQLLPSTIWHKTFLWWEMWKCHCFSLSLQLGSAATSRTKMVGKCNSKTLLLPPKPTSELMGATASEDALMQLIYLLFSTPSCWITESNHITSESEEASAWSVPLSFFLSSFPLSVDLHVDTSITYMTDYLFSLAVLGASLLIIMKHIVFLPTKIIL